MLSLRIVPKGVGKTQGHTAVSTLRRGPDKQTEEWIPPILKTVAHRQEGLAELVDAFAEHRSFLNDTDAGQAIRQQRRIEEFRAILYQALIDEVDERFADEVSEGVRDVVEGRGDPYSVAEALVRRAIGS
jgi:LAO/AO transport system kinase